MKVKVVRSWEKHKCAASTIDFSLLTETRLPNYMDTKQAKWPGRGPPTGLFPDPYLPPLQPTRPLFFSLLLWTSHTPKAPQLQLPSKWSVSAILIYRPDAVLKEKIKANKTQASAIGL